MKTMWQKIYSFFGFWTYALNIDNGDDTITEYKVVYWCCLPWVKFFRKFDIVKWKVRTYNPREELRKLETKIDAQIKNL